MPTAEMKAFIDSTWQMYLKEVLKGKKFYAYSSSTVGYEDGLRAVAGLYKWAEMMKLSPVPYEPYVHIESEMMPQRPSDMIDTVAERLSEMATLPDLGF